MIHKEHPDLRIVRKKPKKPKKSQQTSNKRRINIVPTNVGMIMLSNFDESGDEYDFDSLPPRQQRLERNSDIEDSDTEENIVKIPTRNSRIEEDEESGGGIPDNFFDTDDDIESHSSEKNAKSGKEKESTCDQLNKSNGKDVPINENVDENMEEDDEASVSVSNPRMGLRLSQLTSRIEEMRDILRVHQYMDQLERFRHADESADDDDQEVDEIEEKEMENEESTNKKIKTEDKSENNCKEESSDDDEVERGMDIADIMHLNAVRANKTSRCMSNNSADTSETSGIGSFSEASAFGSFVEDHMPEMTNGHSSSQKSSPDESSPERSYCDQILEEDEMDVKNSENNNDSDEGIVKDKEKDCISVGDDGEPKENIKVYMQEKIYKLPLPEAMKAYINYYRIKP